MGAQYNATQEEQAYARYLLEHVFQITNLAEIRIGGRAAVPFLSQSGVDRGVLRDLWAAVDPQTLGQLTSIGQWETLLRLVALAQAGILGGYLEQARGQSSASAIATCLASTLGTYVPLARFDSVAVPSSSQLAELYQTKIASWTQPYQLQPSSSMGSYGSASSQPMNAFSIGSTASAPSLPPQHPWLQTQAPATQQQQPMEQPTQPWIDPTMSMGSQATTASYLSVSNAFDGLVEVEDQPLPTLAAPAVVEDEEVAAAPTSAPLETTTSVDGMGGWGAPATVGPIGTGDTLGGWGAAPTMGDIMAVGGDQSGTPTAATPMDFGTLGGVAASVPAPSNAVEDDDEEFGDFGSSPTFGQAAAAPEPSGWDALDALAQVEDAPLPTLAPPTPVEPEGVDVVEETTKEEEADDDFGDFASSELTPPVATASAPPIDFAGLGNRAFTPITAPVLPTVAVLPSNDDDNDDDFGDFASPEFTASTPAAAPMPQDEFGGLSGANPAGASQPTTSDAPNDMFVVPSTTLASDVTDGGGAQPSAPAVSGWDALDALGEIQNAPLPDLSQFAAQTSDPVIDVEDDTDGFGEFVGTEDIEQMVDMPSQPPGSFTALSDGLSPLSDGGGPTVAMERSVSAPAPPTNEGSFGAFDSGDTIATAAAQLPPPLPGASTFGDMGKSFSAPLPSAGGVSWDAFDSLAAADDKPLPSLGSLAADVAFDQAGDKRTEPVIVEDDEDDDFGDFVGSDDGIDVVKAGPTKDRNIADGDEIQVETEEPIGVTSGVPSTGESRPPLPKRGVLVNDERLDSEYYSADARSRASSKDLDGFESAIESDNDDGSRVRDASEFIGSGVAFGQHEAQEMGTDGGQSSNDDPFSAFDAIAPPQPELAAMQSIGPQGKSAWEGGGSGGSNAAALDQDVGSPDDDFGEFSGVHVAPTQDQADALASTTAASEQMVSTGGETVSGGFGDLGSAELPSEAVSAEVPEEDEVGDFGGASFDVHGLTVHTSNVSFPPVISAEESEADEFGDFGSAAPLPPDNVRMDGQAEFTGLSVTNTEPVGADGKGDTHEEQPDVLNVAFATGAQGSDGLGDLDTADFQRTAVDLSAPEGTPKGVVDSVVLSESEFGGFERAGLEEEGLPPQTEATVSGTKTFERSATEASQFEEPGRFGSAQVEVASPTNKEAAATTDDDFVSAELTPPSGSEAFEASFGDFEAAVEPLESPVVLSEEAPPLTAEEEAEMANLKMVRKLLVEASMRLPEAIRNKAGTMDHVDFGDCFDANIGSDLPVSDERKRRAQVCLQLMRLLSTSHTKLASTYWEQAMVVAREELAMGAFILEEAANLSKSEAALCRDKLTVFYHGMGELVRVVRSIVASVGDLLMLDVASLLTIDTLASSWCSMPLAKDSLGIEKLWKDLEDLASLLGLAKKQDTEHPLETLSAIRGLAMERGAVPTELLCHFTLQPLALRASNTTKNPIAWNGHAFMACAANFLSHKCPFYAIDI